MVKHTVRSADRSAFAVQDSVRFLGLRLRFAFVALVTGFGLTLVFLSGIAIASGSLLLNFRFRLRQSLRFGRETHSLFDTVRRKAKAQTLDSVATMASPPPPPPQPSPRNPVKNALCTSMTKMANANMQARGPRQRPGELAVLGIDVSACRHWNQWAASRCLRC